MHCKGRVSRVRLGLCYDTPSTTTGWGSTQPLQTGNIPTVQAAAIQPHILPQHLRKHILLYFANRAVLFRQIRIGACQNGQQGPRSETGDSTAKGIRLP